LEFATVRGFKDILPEEAGHWQRLESKVREVFDVFGFCEIKPPLLERTELFSRSIGEETDIVSKEMYSFTDSKGRGLTLRPEATASVVRAYIQHKLYEKNPVQKLYTIGPMFRHERPQKGRFRQFHQIDAEILGDPGPKSDADVIVLAVHLLETVGLTDLSLHINSLGCPECRVRFKDELRAYLLEKTGKLCGDCARRAQTNPLRVFDCKVESCNELVSGAPSILEFVCRDCYIHFQHLQEYLKAIGLRFFVNHKLVRGLDYYSRTTFEVQTERLGTQNAVTGGGRYDGLMKLLGGPDHPAIGFATGVERVIALLGEEEQPISRKPDLFISALGESAENASFPWAVDLRRSGLWVEMEYSSRSLKAQMKKADRTGARYVLIVGEDELKSKKATLRDMTMKTQVDVDLHLPVEHLEKLLK
jgi:histidyl-tRNA synthetase